MMRKLMYIFLALEILAVSFFGCAQIGRDAQIKCPKCGTIFTINEDLIDD